MILLLPLLWAAAAAAVGPVGWRSVCYGCDLRVRKLFPVDLSLSVDRLSFSLKLGRLLIIHFFACFFGASLAHAHAHAVFYKCVCSEIISARADRPDGRCADKLVKEAVLMVGNLFKWVNELSVRGRTFL